MSPGVTAPGPAASVLLTRRLPTPEAYVTNPNSKNPHWWGDSHTSGWDRVKEAMHRDWEQTRSDFSGGKQGMDLNQGAGDTLAQAFGDRPIPAGDRPNPPNAHGVAKAARKQEKVALKLGQQTEQHIQGNDDLMLWEDAQRPVRFGYGAASHYTDEWDDALEARLRQDWEQSYPGQSWDESRELARRGWNHARRPV